MPIAKQQVEDAVRNKEAIAAKELLDMLRQEREGGNLSNEQQQAYAKWEPQLQLIALPRLPFDEIHSFLRSSADYMLRQQNVDPESILQQILVPHSGEGLDAIKQGLYQALEQSTAPLGTIQITQEGGTQEPSTIGAWLRLHVSKVGRGRKTRSENLHYFAQDRNIGKLQQNERVELRKLLQLYNLLQPLPLDDARLSKLTENDIWWGVDAPEALRGMVETEDGQFLTTAEAAQQSQERAAQAQRAQAATASNTPSGGRSTSDIAPAGQSSAVRLDIKRALEKYPAAGDIVITEAPFVGPDGEQKGTVRAWLRDYARVAGIDFHTLKEREAYFFQSEAAKTLTSQDKRNVRLVLQSFDDDLPLSFSSDISSIDFGDGVRRGRGSSAFSGRSTDSLRQRVER